MDEAEYRAELKKRWPRDYNSVEPTIETIELTLKALEDDQNSKNLWIIRQDLLQLVNYDGGFDLSESKKCYKRAI